MAEGARTESAYTPKGYRGFESRFLRSSSGPFFFGEADSVFLLAMQCGLNSPHGKGRAFID